MKNIYLTLILICFGLIANATIRQVDQNPNRPNGYYSNLQVAVNAAIAGDTIFIYPANSTYGDITITKKLHFFGFGFDGTINGVSRISNIYFDTTASPNSSPSGSSLQGLTINYITCSKPSINNIKINGCYFNSSQIQIASNSTGWQILNNLLNTSIEISNSTNVLISNNIFISSANGIYYSNSSTVVISNNIFFNWRYFYNVYNATVANNIFICVGDNNQTYMHNNSFQNNLSYWSSIDTYILPPVGNTGSGNFSNQNPQFISGTPSGSFDKTLDYHLMSSSPGKNAGTDGTDIGPYGGTNPFIWGGAITIPQITEMVITNPIINQGTNLNVKLKAKKADL